ncbi:MAG: DUF6320 domain-containing protein [Hungatella sp.]
MKKNPQGGKWRRLDNTAKIFPVIANEHLSNVFRISMTLKEEIVPELLQQALEEILPWFPGFKVKLRRGFFWYYFESNRRKPEIEEEVTYPCKYIDPHSSPMFLFRVSYYQARINLEVFHAVTDGLGAVNFIRELTYRYLQLLHGEKDGAEPAGPSAACVTDVEDSYLKNYKKTAKRKYSSRKAFHIREEALPLDEENIIHGYVKLAPLKQVCKQKGVSITKYLVACLIYSIYEEYFQGQPMKEHIGVNLPVNLRAFFDSETTANFFAVSCIEYLTKAENATFDEVLQVVCRQMEAKITKEKMEETISYNVSNEKKWYIRIVPLPIKWAAVNLIFRRNDRSHTITLSNIGPIRIDPNYQDQIRRCHVIIGVSKRQPMKCVVCAYEEDIIISFTSVYTDSKIQDRFFGFLEAQQIPVELETNGMVKKEADHGMYPEISYDVSRWKRMKNLFYLLLLTVAACLGVVNYITYSGFLWSGIAIGCILYAGLTMRYSIMCHANLGSKILIQTIGAQALLLAIDFSLGYQGWSVEYAIPSTILFADLAIVFLIIVNRLNWQSYFMYQLTLTIFSFIPVILWASHLIEHPLMTIITVIISVLVLTVTVLLGDRRVKNELIRRFHF